MADRTKRASYSLEDEYVELLREIAWRGRRSMTDELRMLIDARAMAMGMEPVKPVDPKLSVLIVEQNPTLEGTGVPA